MRRRLYIDSRPVNYEDAGAGEPCVLVHGAGANRNYWKALTRDLAGALSHGQRQWLEIGMLLMQEPELLLVDEPVAGMTDHETEQTAVLLKQIAGKRSVVVVEHDMEFVRALATKVTVLHEGSVLSEGTVDHVQNDAKVIEVYLGR